MLSIHVIDKQTGLWIVMLPQRIYFPTARNHNEIWRHKIFHSKQHFLVVAGCVSRGCLANKIGGRFCIYWTKSRHSRLKYINSCKNFLGEKSTTCTQWILFVASFSPINWVSFSPPLSQSYQRLCSSKVDYIVYYPTMHAPFSFVLNYSHLLNIEKKVHQLLIFCGLHSICFFSNFLLWFLTSQTFVCNYLFSIVISVYRSIRLLKVYWQLTLFFGPTEAAVRLLKKVNILT